METRRVLLGRFSPMTLTAFISILALFGVVGWYATDTWRANDIEIVAKSGTPSTLGQTNVEDTRLDWQSAPSSDALDPNDPYGLSNIKENVVGTLVGSYAALEESGGYTDEEGAKIADLIAGDLKAKITYPSYRIEDVTTIEESSMERMLSYRDQLRTALEPLLKNTYYELDVFANYVDTGDKKYLSELEMIGQNYLLARESAARIVVPHALATKHVAILNALSEFESTLAQIRTHADDPFASAALLSTFSSAEVNVFNSFEALAEYFREYQRS